MQPIYYNIIIFTLTAGETVRVMFEAMIYYYYVRWATIIIIKFGTECARDTSGSVILNAANFCGLPGTDVHVESFKTLVALHLGYCSFFIISIFRMSINSDFLQESDTHKSLLAFKSVNNNLHRPQWRRSLFFRFTRFEFCYDN